MMTTYSNGRPFIMRFRQLSAPCWFIGHATSISPGGFAAVHQLLDAADLGDGRV